MTEGRTRPSIWADLMTVFREPGLLLSVGLTLGLYLALDFIPILGMLAGSFTPVPMIVTYWRRGRFFGLAAITVTAAIVSLMYLAFDLGAGLVVFLEYVLLAVLMAEGLRRRLTIEKLVGGVTIMALLLAVVIILTMSLTQGQDVWSFGRDAVVRQVRASFELFTTVVSDSPPPATTAKSASPRTSRADTSGKASSADQRGRSGNNIPADVSHGQVSAPQAIPPVGTGPGRTDHQGQVISGTQELERLAQAVVLIFPGLMTMGTLLVVWANFMLVRTWLAGGNGLPAQYLDLTGWQAPDFLIWPAIACGFGSFLTQGWLQILSGNVLLILGMVYFFQGLAIIAFWLNKRKVPFFVRVVIYLMIGLQQYLALLVASLGLFDIWTDFRKLKAARNDTPG